ncbi:MAG TPA: signal peptidase I [Polyangia bacterium]
MSRLRRRPGGVKTKKAKSTVSSLVELVGIVIVALLLALLIQAFVIKPYRIPSSSMEPTLTIGQRVLVDRLGKLFSSPHVGEIAVFHPPLNAEQEVCGESRPAGAACDLPQAQESSENFIKRIVAGPGDVISILGGHVIRNGKAEKDKYTLPCTPGEQCSFPTKIKIPAGMWFMMGDNRGMSDDSRFWGPVPTKWIIGDAFATYWPPDRIGFL